MVRKKERIVFRSSKRVVLRPSMRKDIKKILVWMNDPEVLQYIRHNFPLYEKEEEEWFEKLGKQKQNDVVLAIETKKGVHIGNTGIHRISWADRIGNIGIFVGDKKYWGKKYGYEAMMLLLEYAFNTLNLRKMCLSVFNFNERAYKCYCRCGFKVEGRKREQYYANGKYHDEIVMAVFRKDWECMKLK